MVTVVCGANSNSYELEGKTVAEAREVLKEVLNIPEGSNAAISGDNVEGTYILQGNDVLEFAKKSGDKGQ
jgi:hypothetical protein